MCHKKDHESHAMRLREDFLVNFKDINQEIKLLYCILLYCIVNSSLCATDKPVTL